MGIMMTTFSLLAQTKALRNQIFSEYPKLKSSVEAKDYEQGLVLINTILTNLPEEESERIREHQEIKCYLYQKRAAALYRKGEAKNAIKICKEADDFISENIGESDNFNTRNLNTLGTVYFFDGQYRKAQKTFLKAKKNKQRRESFDMQYARILNGLGKTYLVYNNFLEAEKNVKKSCELKLALKGKNEDYAKTLSSLAQIYLATGKYNKAQSAMEEVLSIAKTSSHYLDYVQILSSVLAAKNDYKKALDLLEEVKVGREKQQLTNSNNYATTLSSLGQIHQSLKQYDAAFEYISKGNEILKKIHGEKHPHIGLMLRNKADVLLRMDKLNDSEKAILQSIDIITKTYRKKHLEYFKSKFVLAKIKKAQNDFAGSAQIILDIDKILLDHVLKASKYLSTREMSELINLYKDYFNELISISAVEQSNTNLIELAQNNSIFFKGYILEHMVQLRNAISASQEITVLSEELSLLNRELENAFVSNPDSVKELEDKIENVNLQLSRKLGLIRNQSFELKWEDLQYILNDEDVILDFIRIGSNEEAEYVCFITKADEGPKLISLFKEKDLTSNFKSDVKSVNDIIEKLYTFGDRGLNVKDKDISLFDLIWKKLEGHLEDIEKVFYCTDGILHSISLEAIPVESESSLIDSYDFVRMSSMRSLVAESEDINTSDDSAFLIGGVDYGPTDEGLIERSGSKRGAWKKLPATSKEIKVISDYLLSAKYKVDSFGDKEANEKLIKNRLQNNNGYKIVHFATHGFFETSNIFETEDVGEISTTDLNASALVLAGVNEQGTTEDNLFTAFELSNTDLSNAELVVFSACESGLGKISNSQGVYGLQRSAKIAGAHYVIASLWQVPDRQTKEFMSVFYKKYLTENMSIPEAFSQTQREMKDRFIDAYAWAGFVLIE